MAGFAEQRAAGTAAPTTLSLTGARRQIASQRYQGYPSPLMNRASGSANPNLPTPQQRNTSGQFGQAMSGRSEGMDSYFGNQPQMPQMGQPFAQQRLQQAQQFDNQLQYRGNSGPQPAPAFGQMNPAQNAAYRKAKAQNPAMTVQQFMQGQGAQIAAQGDRERRFQDEWNRGAQMQAQLGQQMNAARQAGDMAQFQALQQQMQQFEANRNQQLAAFQGQAQQRQDTVPAMLSPGERVLTPAENQAFQRLPQAGQVLSVDGQPPAAQGMAQQRMALAGQVLRFAQGGVVPETGISQPPEGVVPPSPITPPPPAPAVPGQTPPVPPPTAPGSGFAGLRQELAGFGAAPTYTPELMARIRAQESQRLANIERGQLANLGAAAASSGALMGGDVKSLAAGLAAQRLASESEFGLGLERTALDQQREDWRTLFGTAGEMARQREQNVFGREERLGSQEFAKGERLGAQDYAAGESAKGRAFNAEESAKQRTFISSESDKQNLHQMALAEKQIAADMARLQTQIAEAQRAQDSDQVNRLTMQAKDLEQRQAEVKQANDQFLLGYGLDRDRFDRANTEFDFTRQDGIAQFAATLDLQNRQLEQNNTQFETQVRERADQFTRELAQNLGISQSQLATQLQLGQMNDATERYIADQVDRYNRDLNAARIDPTTLQTILGAGGQVADILNALGVTGPQALGAVGSAVGALGGLGAVGGALGAAAGVAVPVAAGLAAAYGIWKGVEALGPSESTKRKDEFTKGLDDVLGVFSGQRGVGPMTPEQEAQWWAPENRQDIVNQIASFAEVDAQKGNGISEQDWQRLQSLGLAVGMANEKGEWIGWALADDPAILASLKPGDRKNVTVTGGESGGDDGARRRFRSGMNARLSQIGAYGGQIVGG